MMKTFSNRIIKNIKGNSNNVLSTALAQDEASPSVIEGVTLPSLLHLELNSRGTTILVDKILMTRQGRNSLIYRALNAA